MTDLDVYMISREAKKPNGMPPIVFVHGAFAGAWCWDEHFMPWFCDRGYNVHAVDLPGRRGRPDYDRLQSFNVSDYLDALLTTIDAMPEPPVVVGHSMGGFLAWRAAELRKLAGIVLMAPVPPTGLAAPAMQLMLTSPALYMNVAQIHAGGGASIETLHETLFAPAVPRALVAAYLPKFQSESQLAVAGLYAGHIPNILALWGTPIEVFGAAEDRLIPPAHAHWTASLTGRSAHIYEDMGHGMMLEAGWKAVAADIANRLEAKCRR